MLNDNRGESELLSDVNWQWQSVHFIQSGAHMRLKLSPCVYVFSRVSVCSHQANTDVKEIIDF